MRRNAAAVMLLVVGCGGASATDVRAINGPTNFQAVYASFWMFDAMAVTTGQALSDGVFGTQLDIHISDAPLSCDGSDAGALASPGSLREVDLSVFQPNPQPFIAGEYQSPGPGLFSATYLQTRDSCFLRDDVLTGTLTIRRLASDEVEGSVDFMLQDGTEVKGDFVAGRCPAPSGFFTSLDGGLPSSVPCSG